LGSAMQGRTGIWIYPMAVGLLSLIFSRVSRFLVSMTNYWEH
jgi:hypothetical protein